MARGVQTKVLEAMAMALPVVLSSKAAAGIGAETGREYLVTDDFKEMACAIVRLIASPAEAEKLGAAARKFIEENYQWSDTSALYEKIVLEAAGRSAPSGRMPTAPGG